MKPLKIAYTGNT